MAGQRSRTPRATTALATSLAALLSAWRPNAGCGGFIAIPQAASLHPEMQSLAAAGRAIGAARTGGGSSLSKATTGSVAFPVLGSLCLLAAAKLSRRPPPQLPSIPVAMQQGPSVLAGAAITRSLSEPTADESRVLMYSAGGRRKRLGVGGKVCMLTGAKKFKGFTRSFHGKKAIRYWRPNVRWSKLWWKREKKWVRLFTTDDAIRLVDQFGLEHMCRKAGLDLYSWCKPHWEPGSRQPLALKVGYSPQAKKDLKRWPDYMHLLNKGRPLADYLPGPDPLQKPTPLKMRKLMRNPATPPKRLNVTMISK